MSKEKKPTFEQSMQRLEAIVAALESPDTSLDTSLALFTEGAGLIEVCNKTLEEAQLKVETLFPEGAGVDDE